GWNDWSGFDKLLGQMVRWSMRPSGDDSRLNVATETADGRVNVVVTALDKEDRFVDFLELGGSVIGPDMKRQAVRLQQTSPGRYVGSFDADDAGSYFLTLGSGGRASVRAGVNVPYSDEFRDRQS